MMERENILAKLSENRQMLTAHGIKEIRLFGSFVRGVARAGSDVDLLVEFEPSAPVLVCSSFLVYGVSLASYWDARWISQPRMPCTSR